MHECYILTADINFVDTSNYLNNWSYLFDLCQNVSHLGFINILTICICNLQLIKTIFKLKLLQNRGSEIIMKLYDFMLLFMKYICFIIEL